MRAAGLAVLLLLSRAAAQDATYTYALRTENAACTSQGTYLGVYLSAGLCALEAASQGCPPSAAHLAPTDGGWRRWAGVCSEVRKRVYTCGVS